MASMALKSSPSPFSGQSQLQRIQPSTLQARSSSFRVMSKKAKKVQSSQPFGPGGGLELKDGVDASGRPAKGKGVYQFASNPIYNPEEWSPSGDYYAGGKTGLLLWVVTLAGILLGGALLVYNTSDLAS
uniref:Photosystem II 10 kDa polypeptide, chloroplastic n=1 Tax=Triticum urartu TaxID=4572 RepID=A0A8R7TH36_TRIUA